MNKEVRIGEIKVAKSDDNLISLGIGSCLVIAFYDPRQKVGALTHTMLASRLSANSNSLDTRYTDTAIDEMIKKIERLGAKRENLEAKLIGGANMFSAFKSNIGENNILYARKKLKSIGIAIVGECIGGSQGRSVEFSVATGVVTVKTKF